jgi:succinate dehydrogenase / fumarate reductase, cytochrome b subunit
MHHMLGGIRHFVWDTGRGFGVEEREWLARATIFGSLALTAVIWGVALFVMR